MSSGKLVSVELNGIGTVLAPKIETKILLNYRTRKRGNNEKLDELFSFSQDLTSLYISMDKDPVLRDLKQRLRVESWKHRSYSF